MTLSLRTIPGGRNGRNGHGAPIRRHDLAPALFRLLSDSAMSRAALASCGAAVAIVEAQGAGWPIAYLNPVFERLFGHLNVDVGGRALLSLIFRADPLVQDRLLEAVRAPHDVCAVHKNGMPLEVEIVLGPVHDSSGRLTHWVLTFADRTELARLRAEVAALRSGRAA
jgi:PAS domain S-box-containing protein